MGAQAQEAPRRSQAQDEQDRLDRLIVESIGKSGEKYAAPASTRRPPGFYLRVAKEFPDHKLRGGVDDERRRHVREGQAARAGRRGLPRGRREVPRRAPDAAGAAFTAGRVYEQVAYFDRAAEPTSLVARKYPRSDAKAADALFNAGVLRQALGQHHKTRSATTRATPGATQDRKDAAEVAFRIGVVYEEAGDDGARRAGVRAATSRRYRDGTRVVEAHTRAGRAVARA